MSLKLQSSNLKHPALIVGGGLAGTTLAWRLWQRGVPFVLVDPDKPDTCSKIAAGLITPITGMRLNVGWRMAELLPEAMTFYREVETRLGTKMLHEVPHVRLLRNERESALWQTRRLESAVLPWLVTQPQVPLVDEAAFHAEHGGFQQAHSGWLDTALYQQRSREFFAASGAWLQGEVSGHELAAHKDGIHWQEASYQCAVLCRGADERNTSQNFPWLKWDCARGVIAQLDSDIAESRIINRGVWMLPRDGHWRAGSTYEFDFSAPVEASAEALQNKLRSLLKLPFGIRDAKAGVRPILKHKKPVLGRHPAHRHLAIFNGLGSKGSLQAPFFARMLVNHLVDGTPVEDAVDVAANG